MGLVHSSPCSLPLCAYTSLASSVLLLTGPDSVSVEAWELEAIRAKVKIEKQDSLSQLPGIVQISLSKSHAGQLLLSQDLSLSKS